MNFHMHIGTVDFIPLVCYFVIFGFLWRTLSARWADNSVGQAMAYIY